jgi:hypothetical protein
MAFQYIMPTPVDMSDVFAPLMHARQANKDREAKRAELLLRKEAANRENARLDEQMRHTSELENRQKSLDTANAIPKIKNMLTPGHPDYDPESGLSLARAYGINLAAQQPEMPKPPEAIPDKPLSALPEGVDAVSGGAAPPEAAQNTALDATRSAQQGEYTNKLIEARRRAPTYSGSGPFGAVNIDPNAAIASRNEALRQQQERLAPLTGAAGEKYAPVVKAMIDAGMPGSEVAKFLAEKAKEDQQDATKAQYNLTAADQNRHNKAMEAAAMLNAGRQDRGDADKRRDKEDETTVRDENGVPIGHVPTGRGGAQGFATRDADYSRGEQMLQGLLDDIEKSGNRALTPEETLRRQTLYNNAVIGVATVSPLGKTDEAQKLERSSIGPSGAVDLHSPTGILTGANPEAIRRKLAELRDQRARYRAQTLIPLSERPAQQGPQQRQPARKSNPIIDARHRPSLDDLAAEHGL